MEVEFREIDKTNYEECIKLTVSNNQKRFVAPNQDSLVQAAYEEDLYPLGIYQNNKMVGFILYDYDIELAGWSMSRFMIDFKYQNSGIGKEALLEFINYFKEKHGDKPLFTSAEVDNNVAINMYKSIGFKQKEIFEYMHNDITYREVRMIKILST